MAMVSLWTDWVFGGHTCAVDATIYISVYTIAEELGDSRGGGAGVLYEQEGGGEDYHRSGW